MLQGIIIKKVIDIVLKKIMEKHKLDKLQKYVEEDNELDIQIRQMQKTITKQGRYIEELEKEAKKMMGKILVLLFLLFY